MIRLSMVAYLYSLDEPIEDYFQREGLLDYTFDCIGNQAVLNSAYKSLSPWGALTVIGNN